MISVVGEDKEMLHRITCKRCAAILEYTLHDVKERHGKDYSGGSDGQEWIDCPRCGNAVVIRSW